MKKELEELFNDQKKALAKMIEIMDDSDRKIKEIHKSSQDTLENLLKEFDYDKPRD